MREVTIDMGAVYCAIQMRRILTNQVDTLIPCSLCWCLFFIHCSFETRSGFTSEISLESQVLEYGICFCSYFLFH